MRIIAHVDMDAFYAAVEERHRPELRGRPVVVGADPKGGTGRGVVTAASYAARAYGIRSALPISRAWQLAEAARRRGLPEAVFVRDDHRLYREVSGRIMALLAEGADAFQAASIDEAYLDLSSLETMERAEAHARALKAAVREREGLTCSVGLGPNKLVAKIASDARKPDGLTAVPPEAVQAFLDPLGIRALPGIGPKTEAALRARGIATVAELRAVAREQLAEWLGRHGADLHDRAHGRSDSPVSGARVRKTVGEQETFEVDSRDQAFVLGRARALGEEVFRRLVNAGFASFRTVTVTVRFTGFVTVSRARTGPAPRTTADELHDEVRGLLEPFFDTRENPKGIRIRLIGVRVEKLARAAVMAGAAAAAPPVNLELPVPAPVRPPGPELPVPAPAAPAGRPEPAAPAF